MSGRLPGNFHHAFDVGSVADNFDEKMVCHYGGRETPHRESNLYSLLISKVKVSGKG